MENGKYQISFAPIYGQETKNEEEKKTEDPEQTLWKMLSHRQRKQ